MPDIQLYITIYSNTISTHQQTHTQTKLGFAFSDIISGMIPTGIRVEEIWSRGAESRDVRQDQIRDGIKVTEKEMGTL